MFQRIMILLCLGLMGAMSPAKAQTPPVTVPAESQIVADDANLALKKDLDQRYQALLQEFNKWNADATAFNGKYGGKNLDADTQEAKEGLAEQARVSQALQTYQSEADQFKNDVGRLRLESPGNRVINGIRALAKRLGWSAEKQARLNTDLNNLDIVDGTPVDSDQMINSEWNDVEASSQDAELIQEASQDGGLGFPGAGKQSFSDCAIFALANAAGLPYGVVAARANLLISQAEWRTDDEQKDPQGTIQRQGINGGEMIMLAETFGQAEVVKSSDFAGTLKEGRPIMVNVGANDWGHEVVLTKTFQHGGETWYVMMDSSQNPDQRRFVSAKVLNSLLKENGVAYRPEPGTTPKLLRDGGGQ
jgi:hypothetical protein